MSDVWEDLLSLHDGASESEENPWDDEDCMNGAFGTLN